MVKSKKELIYEATLSLIEDNYQLTQIKVSISFCDIVCR